MITVAHIGLRGIDSAQGGVEACVTNLIPFLSKKTKLVIYIRSRYYSSSIQADGYELVSLPTIYSKHLEAFCHTFICTIHACWKRPNVIHYHAIGNAYWSWLPRIFGIKTLVTVHGLDWKRDKWSKIAKCILRFGEFIAANCPNHTTVVARNLVVYFEQRYSRNVSYIPNGIKVIDTESLNTLNPLGKYIIYLGRLVPEKRVDLLIKAYLELDTKVGLIIVGGDTHSSDYVEDLKVLASRNENIKFLGAVFGEQKNKLLINALIFVLPSIIEGMSIALLEAMSLGVPCVVSDIEENKNIVIVGDKKFAITFQSEDYNDLAKTLSSALTSQYKLKEMADAAKEYVIKNYSWENVANKYNGIYQKI